MKTIAIAAAATALLLGLAPMPASAQAVQAPAQQNAAQPASPTMSTFKAKQVIETALVRRGDDGEVAFYAGAGIGRSTVTTAHVVGTALMITVIGGHGRKFSCPLNALGEINVDSDSTVTFYCGLPEQAFLAFVGDDGPMASQVAAALRVLESNAGPPLVGQAEARTLVEHALVARGYDGRVSFFSGSGLANSTITDAHVMSGVLAITVRDGNGAKFQCPLNALGNITLDAGDVIYFHCGQAAPASLTFEGDNNEMTNQVADALRFLEARSAPPPPPH